MVQACAVAEEHCIQHPRVVFGQLHGQGHPAVRFRVNITEHSTGGPALRRIDSARKACNTACNNPNLCCAHVCVHADALRQQVVCVLPCSGVVVALRHLQSQRYLDYIAAVELRRRCILRHDCRSYASCDWHHTRDIGRYLFDRFYCDIDRLSMRSIGLLLDPPGWIVAISRLVLWREVAYADHSAPHCAAQSIGVLGQRVLRGRNGPQLPAPESCRDPKSRHRKHGDARRPTECKDRECRG